MSNVNYQQPTWHHHKTNSHRPVHAYQKLPEFAIKLQKQKLFNVSSLGRFLRLLSMMAPALNSLWWTIYFF